MLDFWITTILFSCFGGIMFRHTIGISMCTNCAPLLTDLFLNTYDADFTQGLLKNKDF